jgi:putative heme-binding domain-containing protein
MQRLAFALILSLGFSASSSAADPTVGLKLPAGFTITQYAGPELANDIYCLHVDAEGRVVVAGKGYVRYLVDRQGKGVADKAIELIPAPKDGPMGLLWEKENLFVVCDGGLQKFTGVNGKAPTKVAPETILAMKTAGEHEGHAVKRGADGFLYWMCGNMAGVTEKAIRGEGSPVKQPVAGCLLKLSDDAKLVHIICDGFRNAYDFDFNLHAEPFTFDSDNERCQGLPWFEPTRFYHIIPGGNYGWLSPQHAQTWRKPSYFPDVVAPVFTVGRGSPTGVACYRHEAFPEKYRGGFFLADWTFGKIWFGQPEWKKGRYTGTPEVFIEATGENGFAPTGLAVCPKTGDLFVSIGGRGTRGAVYRIHAEGAKTSSKTVGYEPPPKREFAPTTREWRVLTAHLRGLQKQTGDFVDPKAIGTAWEGYSLRNPIDESIASTLRTRFFVMYKNADELQKREYGRLWAAIGDDNPRALTAILSFHMESQSKEQVVHDLIVLAKLTGPRTEVMTKTIAELIVTLDERYSKDNTIRDRFWPLRLTEVVTELLKLDPKLAEAIVTHASFGSPEHVWLAKVPGMDKAKAAQAFLKQAAAAKNYEWNSGQIELLGELPEPQRREALLKLWNRGFDDAIVLQLANSPLGEDQAKFIGGLSSLQAGTVAASADALAKLSGVFAIDNGEIVPLIRGLRRFADAKTDIAVRAKIVARLQQISLEKIADDTKAWESWLQTKHPDLAKQLTTAGYDAAKWKERLAEVKWEAGQAERGKLLFAKAQCAACHNGGTSAGPSLQGVSKRFSRDDLLIAILDPNRDVSPRYRTQRITTVEDKVFEGVVVHEATDGIILQTGADSTIRIAGKDIAGKKPGVQSLMPVGLLDMFKPDEIADLLAYIKTL